MKSQPNALDVAYQQDRLYNRILVVLCSFFLIFGLIVPFIQLPEIEREELEKLPPRLARVVLEKKAQPKPIAKPITKPKPKPQAEKKKIEPPKQQLKEASKPKPQVAKKRVRPRKTTPPPTSVARQKAREKASQSGLLAMKNELSSLKNSFQVASIKPKANPNRAATANSTKRSSKDAAKTVASALGQEALARKDRGTTSNTTLESYQGSQVALAAHSSKKVESDLIEKVANSGSPINNGSNSRKESQTRKSAKDTNQRSEEAIRAHFDSNKGAIFALYNRALRKNPTLQGKVVVELTIESDGKVSFCKIINTELNDRKLERKLVMRVKMINFGEQKVDPITMQYAFDFLPT